MSGSDDEKDGNNELPIENVDDLYLYVIRHTRFDPDEKVELPSGKVISGREAQEFIAAFMHSEPGFGPEDDPYDALDRAYLIDPDLQSRAKEVVRSDLFLPNPVYISSRPRNIFIRVYRWFRDLRRR